MEVVRSLLLGLHLITLAVIIVLAIGGVIRSSTRLVLPLRLSAIVMGLSGLGLVGTLAALDEPINAPKLLVKLLVVVAVVVTASLVGKRLRDESSGPASARQLTSLLIALALVNTGIAYGWS